MTRRKSEKKREERYYGYINKHHKVAGRHVIYSRQEVEKYFLPQHRSDMEPVTIIVIRGKHAKPKRGRK